MGTSVIPPGTPEWPESKDVALWDADDIAVKYAPGAQASLGPGGVNIFGIRTQMDGVGYLVAHYPGGAVIYKFVDRNGGSAWVVDDIAIVKRVSLDDVMAALPSYLIRNALS